MLLVQECPAAALPLLEQELAAGIMKPVPGLTFQSRYGILRRVSHSLPPAAMAFIAEMRALEAEFVQREKQLAVIYG